MASCSLLVALFLSLSVLSQVSGKSAGIISDISNVPLNAVTESSQNIDPFSIITDCDCGEGSLMCALLNGKKICACEPGRVQIGETCTTVVSSGWKTATIVLSVFFAIAIVGFGVFVFKSRQ